MDDGGLVVGILVFFCFFGGLIGFVVCLIIFNLVFVDCVVVFGFFFEVLVFVVDVKEVVGFILVLWFLYYEIDEVIFFGVVGVY